METVSTIGRLLISLAAVRGLMWVIARKVGKRTGAGKSTRVVEVPCMPPTTVGSRCTESSGW